MRVFALLLAGVLLVPAMAAADVVERRGAEGPLEGTIEKMDDSGLTIRSALGAAHAVSWDRVRSVRLAQADRARQQQLERLAGLGKDLWRARTRLERGDVALAEPVFHRLYQTTRGHTHETALIVAEGLLRCRAARGEQAEALVPALEVLRLRRAGVASASYSRLRPIIDEETGLCPLLPPVWVTSRGLRQLEQDLAGFDARGDAVVASLAAWYRRSVARDLGAEAAESAAGGAADHPGVRLLSAAVRALAADGEVRRAARQDLEQARETLPAWCEAWTNFFSGLSLLRESGAGQRDLGLVFLAHLPARFGRTQRYLSGMALGRMIETLERQGAVEGAAALRGELARSYAGHPIAPHGKLP